MVRSEVGGSDWGPEIRGVKTIAVFISPPGFLGHFIPINTSRGQTSSSAMYCHFNSNPCVYLKQNSGSVLQIIWNASVHFVNF